jgi:hypothetical protein
LLNARLRFEKALLSYRLIFSIACNACSKALELTFPKSPIAKNPDQIRVEGAFGKDMRLLDAFEIITPSQRAENLFNSSTVVGAGLVEKSTLACTNPECSFSATSGETEADPPWSIRVPSITTPLWAVIAPFSTSDFVETMISGCVAGFGSFSLITAGCSSAPTGAFMSFGSDLGFFSYSGKSAWLL